MILAVAWRETRGAGRHVLSFLACITLGVAALVAVGSVGHSLERTVTRTARSLLGADVEIRSSQPLSAESQRVVESLARAGAVTAEIREMVAMARAGDLTRLVELKVVGKGYPLYGGPVTDPARPLAELIGDGRALVHESLLGRLGLRVGDRFRIGGGEFTVSGRVVAEPDRGTGVFSLGPRVIIAAADLPGTGLVQPGSRVRHRMLVRVPEGQDIQAVRDDLAARLLDPALRVTTYRQAQPGLRRFWAQLTMYLGLSGRVALLVGGIGVATSVGAFIRSRRATIAILKCLGVPWRRVLAIYLVQTAMLGLAGSVAGAALGSALQPVLAPALARLVPFEVELAISPLAILRGLAMGLGVTVCCALWPLLAIRRVPPALIFRRDVEIARAPRREWAMMVPIAAGLAGLALWQAGAWKVGAFFIGGSAAALGLLVAAAWGVMAVVRRLPPLPSPVWRHGVASLGRPGSHAPAVLVTLGLAVMLIVSVGLLERSIEQEIVWRGAATAPAFFFVDIQPDQADAFSRLVTERTGAAPPELIPVVRARLSAIKGAAIARDRGQGEQWQLTREYALTWADTPPGRNTVVAGRWWTPAEADREPLISVEEEIARTLGVDLGDTLTFDVQGVPVTARVQSLRKVDWRSFGANFFMIFSPGALDGAPATYLATARVAPAGEAALQSAVARAFPNVSAVPVREVLERMAGVVDQIAFAVRLVAAMSVLAGAVVLAGALAVTRAQRLYESVILRAV
ncbi:MAG TPA: ABC transporter permease, partial [Candidatus Limnocylindrales bacterium]|nr:ABC transporter permease [Candidatus Limnocylindrales bacterium]